MTHRQGWTRAQACRLVAALLLVAAGLVSGPAQAAVPTVGDFVEGAIEVGTLRRIPLPQGRWQVAARLDEAPRPTVPAWHHLVLLNTQEGQDVTALVLEFTLAARINSSHQPCDQAASRANLLTLNAFDTAGNAVVVRCNHAYTVANLRSTVQKAPSSSNAWVARHLGPLSAQAGRFPRQALVQQGYLSRMNADWLSYVAYLKLARSSARLSPPRGNGAGGFLRNLWATSNCRLGTTLDHLAHDETRAVDCDSSRCAGSPAHKAQPATAAQDWTNHGRAEKSPLAQCVGALMSR